jgi:hypothetical protein
VKRDSGTASELDTAVRGTEFVTAVTNLRPLLVVFTYPYFINFFCNEKLIDIVLRLINYLCIFSKNKFCVPQEQRFTAYQRHCSSFCHLLCIGPRSLLLKELLIDYLRVSICFTGFSKLCANKVMESGISKKGNDLTYQLTEVTFNISERPHNINYSVQSSTE